MFVTQNDMKLPIRRRKNEFAALTDDEVGGLEGEIARAFDSSSDAARKPGSDPYFPPTLRNGLAS